MGTRRRLGRPLKDDKSEKAASGFLALARRHRPDGGRRRVVPDLSRTGRAGFVSVSLRGALKKRAPLALPMGLIWATSPCPACRRRQAPRENPRR